LENKRKASKKTTNQLLFNIILTMLTGWGVCVFFCWKSF
jgi:hypothetical protein